MTKYLCLQNALDFYGNLKGNYHWRKGDLQGALICGGRRSANDCCRWFWSEMVGMCSIWHGIGHSLSILNRIAGHLLVKFIYIIINYSLYNYNIAQYGEFSFLWEWLCHGNVLPEVDFLWQLIMTDLKTINYQQSMPKNLCCWRMMIPLFLFNI